MRYPEGRQRGSAALRLAMAFAASSAALTASAQAPADAPTEQPNEQPNEQPIEQPIEQPTEQPNEQPNEQPAVDDARSAQAQDGPTEPIAAAAPAPPAPPAQPVAPIAAAQPEAVVAPAPTDPPAPSAQPAAPPGAPSSPYDGPRAWPVVTAVLPGVIAHGTGHLVAGETTTGLRLLSIEGVGVGAAVAGLAGLAVTGAAPRFVLPFIAISAGGGALFMASALADLYGVVAPAGGFGHAVTPPALVLEVGPRYIEDRVFAHDALGYLGATAWLSRTRIEGSGFVGLDHANQRLRALAAYRLLRFDAATYVDVELASTHHRYGPERFSMTFFELALSGRLGLDVIGPTLQGAFFDYALGYALGMNRQFGVATESDEMTLLRFGFGFFVGDGGEVSAYYDHRHDDYAAGLKVPGLGSGPLGHFGLRGSHYFTDAWGVSGYAETGSAHVLGASLLYRRRSW